MPKELAANTLATIHDTLKDHLRLLKLKDRALALLPLKEASTLLPILPLKTLDKNSPSDSVEAQERSHPALPSVSASSFASVSASANALASASANASAYSSSLSTSLSSHVYSVSVDRLKALNDTLLHGELASALELVSDTQCKDSAALLKALQEYYILGELSLDMVGEVKTYHQSYALRLIVLKEPKAKVAKVNAHDIVDTTDTAGEGSVVSSDTNEGVGGSSSVSTNVSPNASSDTNFRDNTDSETNASYEVESLHTVYDVKVFPLREYKQATRKDIKAKERLLASRGESQSVVEFASKANDTKPTKDQLSQVGTSVSVSYSNTKKGDGNASQGYSHEYFMALAIEEAKKAFELGEVPVGAVIVDSEGKVLGRGHNLTITNHDATAHAEIVAMRDASAKLQNYRLNNLTLYVTLEPCCMCAMAMIHARIKTVIYGAKDDKTGACGSVFNLMTDERHNHLTHVIAGIEELKCAKVIKDFFKLRRLSRKNK